MNFDEMNVEQLEARQTELAAMGTDGTTEDLEARANELEAIRAELEARKAAAEAAEELRQDVAEGHDAAVKVFKEERTMTYEVNSPEYRDAFLRHLMGKELTAEERTAVTAAAAIPTETANKIWGKLELYPILNAIDVMHVPNGLVMPVEGTINNAAVVAMGNAATDSADTLAPVSLGAYKLIKTVEITADVAAMAIPAFESWLVDRLANKLFRLAATKVAAGTGTNEPTGLATITATGNTYTSTGITYADLLKIIASVPSEYLPGASFVMSRDTFWKGVKALKTDNDVRVVNTDVGSPAAYNILGFPVILEDQIGTDVIFGDLKEGYVLNFAKDVTIDRDESVAFRTGSTVFRGMALADGKPTGVGLVRYTKAS